MTSDGDWSEDRWTESGGCLRRRFRFADFSEAFGFMTRVALARRDRRSPPRLVELVERRRDLAHHPLGGLDGHRQGPRPRRGHRQAARVRSVTPTSSGSSRPAASVGIDIEPFHFPDGTKTAADAAAAIGVEVGQIVKSLIFAVDGEVVLAYVSGRNQLDERKLAAAAGGCDVLPGRRRHRARGDRLPDRRRAAVRPRHAAAGVRRPRPARLRRGVGRRRHVERRVRDRARPTSSRPAAAPSSTSSAPDVALRRAEFHKQNRAERTISRPRIFASAVLAIGREIVQKRSNACGNVGRRSVRRRRGLRAACSRPAWRT